MADEAEDPIAPDIDAQQADADAKGDPERNELAETTAALMGWKPRDQWKGEDSKFTTAEEFLANVPKINKKLRETAANQQAKLDRVVAEVAKLSKAQRQQMDSQTEAALEAAIESGDTDAAKKIMARVKETAAGGESNGEHPAFTSFKDRNDWFNVDDEATAYAMALDRTLDKNGSAATDPDAHMKRVEAGVKKRFPELFGEVKQEPAREERKGPLVARANGVGARRNNGPITAADLTPQQRAAARQYSLSDDDWAKALEATRAKERATA